MILFKGPRDQLLSPLQSVCGIVEKRHTLPILSNVLMEKNGEKLTLLATDIEIQITTETPTVGPEKAAMTVGAESCRTSCDRCRNRPRSAWRSKTSACS
jgi:DNA polymerase-3 subunit beta